MGAQKRKMDGGIKSGPVPLEVSNEESFLSTSSTPNEQDDILIWESDDSDSDEEAKESETNDDDTASVSQSTSNMGELQESYEDLQAQKEITDKNTKSLKAKSTTPKEKSSNH
ncbi:aspartate and serine-rich protein-like [Homalodisca vitripennis]|uniref:aspartate and serine-rich protein-like n=1 Tax=Homalodisca vitripennis TaxID=197043 RepID=UPI001EEC3A37|nr:aspartate and serine-rich protein-like [Homalodisca vitripennis]